MGTPITLHLDLKPSAADIRALADGLSQHALPTTRIKGFVPLAVLARAADGALVGGVQGTINWNWLHVALFWIAESHRHQGLGKQLLQAIEDAACERGCSNAHLDTFSYQARPFYEAQGYRVFATLDNYPPGQQRFFMRKTLNSASGD